MEYKEYSWINSVWFGGRDLTWGSVADWSTACRGHAHLADGLGGGALAPAAAADDDDFTLVLFCCFVRFCIIVYVVFLLVLSNGVGFFLICFIFFVVY